MSLAPGKPGALMTRRSTSRRGCRRWSESSTWRSPAHGVARTLVGARTLDRAGEAVRKARLEAIAMGRRLVWPGMRCATRTLQPPASPCLGRHVSPTSGGR
jgi:hypothetical protein